VVGGALALLCLGGASVAYVLYDRATAPDRSSPDVAVVSFLQAFLVDRDDTTAKLYACGDLSQLAELRALREDLQSREKRFMTTFRVSWEILDVREERGSAEVSVTLTVTNGTDYDLQPWRVVTLLDDGWRVCGARRVS
jgi:hypothetical protein